MKFIKAAFIGLFTILLVNVSFSQTYSKVKIQLNSKEDYKKLNSLGVSVDHGVLKKNWFETDLSSTEIQTVRDAGFTCEILIADVSAYYANRNKQKKSAAPAASVQSNGCNTGAEVAQPTQFTLGSMGGYFTYAEFIAHLDNMATLYPNLITVKAPISNYQTIGGRPIYFVKISDNVSQNESSEPQVLYTSVHHAREPLGLSQLIFYMYFVLENYSTNPYVKYAVDNTEMFFVPMVNPDGYVYNETTNPNGGGMWRKNRRPNGGNSYGVDPNRNYDYEWGTTGTSTNGNNETYCGTAPFSEAETQAMKWFIENRNFKLALNYHTYSNLLLFPWGYTQSLQCVDNDLFQAMADNFATTTELFVEQSSTLYEASGDSDDWAYGDTTGKPKVFAMTPELGSDNDGFWPTSDRIIPVSKEQVPMNLKVAYTAGNYGVVSDAMPLTIGTTTGYLKYNLQRLGLQNGSFTVSITPLTNIQTVGNANTHSGLTFGQTVTDSISYVLSPGVTDGNQLRYVLAVDNGLVVFRDTITKLFGVSESVFSNSGAPLNQWVTTGAWGLSTTTYFSAPNSLTDTPSGNYTDNTNSSAKTTQAINLDSANYAYLRFKAKWDIEAGYDYAQVSASVDGQSWTPLCGKYTHPGNVNQDLDMPLYDGVQSGWVNEEIDLSAYVGLQIYLRYSLVSDQGVNGDGIYIDDVSVDIIKNKTVGVAEYIANTVNVYPNPAAGKLHIAAPAGSVVGYNVYNVVGQSVASGVYTQSNPVDVANLTSGMYYIRLNVNGYTVVKRFVKE